MAAGKVFPYLNLYTNQGMPAFIIIQQIKIMHLVGLAGEVEAAGVGRADQALLVERVDLGQIAGIVGAQVGRDLRGGIVGEFGDEVVRRAGKLQLELVEPRDRVVGVGGREPVVERQAGPPPEIVPGDGGDDPDPGRRPVLADVGRLAGDEMIVGDVEAVGPGQPGAAPRYVPVEVTVPCGLTCVRLRPSASQVVAMPPYIASASPPATIDMILLPMAANLSERSDPDL